LLALTQNALRLAHHKWQLPSIMSSYLSCPYCGRTNFSTKRGLSQHQQRNKYCLNKINESFGMRRDTTMIAHDYLQMTTILKPSTQQYSVQTAFASAVPAQSTVAQPSEPVQQRNNKRTFSDVESMSSNDSVQTVNDDGLFDLQFAEIVNEPGEYPASPASSSTKSGPDFSLREQFKLFMGKQIGCGVFTQDEVNAIKLLCTLRKTRAPLSAYESVMHWHFVSNGSLHPWQTVHQSLAYIPREKLFTKLRKRYNCTEGYHNITKITLPHSKAKATIVWNDAKAAMTSLLTDPRIVDEDYLFFGNDPLASPPSQLNYVEDLNTGRAYTETYAKLISKPGKQVLLPVIFYIDAANTGHFADLPVTAVKFSLGIFSRKAREKDHMWRILGYIPAISKHKSRGRRIMLDSMHVDGVMAYQDALEDEGLADDTAVSKAQDFHKMLEIVLDSYVDLQNTGFMWDLQYRNKD
jgi:hypothetical protein